MNISQSGNNQDVGGLSAEQQQQQYQQFLEYQQQAQTMQAHHTMPQVTGYLDLDHNVIDIPLICTNTIYMEIPLFSVYLKRGIIFVIDWLYLVCQEKPETYSSEICIYTQGDSPEISILLFLWSFEILHPMRRMHTTVNFLNCGLKQSAKIHALKLPPAPGFCGFPKLSGKPHICGKPLKIVFMLN